MRVFVQRVKFENYADFSFVTGLRICAFSKVVLKNKIELLVFAA